jgi:hypothetical protein
MTRAARLNQIAPRAARTIRRNASNVALPDPFIVDAVQKRQSLKGLFQSTAAYDVARDAGLNGKRRVRPDLCLEEFEEIGTGQTLVFGLREDGD